MIIYSKFKWSVWFNVTTKCHRQLPAHMILVIFLINYSYLLAYLFQYSVSTCLYSVHIYLSLEIRDRCLRCLRPYGECAWTNAAIKNYCSSRRGRRFRTFSMYICFTCSNFSKRTKRLCGARCPIPSTCDQANQQTLAHSFLFIRSSLFPLPLTTYTIIVRRAHVMFQRTEYMLTMRM